MKTKEEIEVLIVKEFTDSISNNEVSELKTWREFDVLNEKEYQAWKSTWEKSQKVSAFGQEDAACAWLNCRQRMNFSEVKRNFSFGFVRKIAAVLLPLVVLGSLYMAYQTVPGFGKLQAFSPATKNDSILLKDNTQVFLAKGSTLVYSKNVDSNVRHVKLQGQGFFKVAHDESKPFLISIGDAQVEVIGTQFNLLENQVSHEVELYVTQGKVKLSSGSESAYVSKGEMAIVVDSRISKRPNDNLNYISWKTGNLSFEASDFNSTIKTVTNHFASIKTVEVEGDEPKNKITSRFVNPSLDEVLNELAIHFNKKMTFDNGKLLISD